VVSSIYRVEPWPRCRSLVDGELLTQGEVLERELSVAAEEERKEPEQVEKERAHETRLWAALADRSGYRIFLARDKFLIGTGHRDAMRRLQKSSILAR
jgi:hypothetical protein